MAGISTTITLIDKLTAPLTSMNNALNMLVATFDDANQASHLDVDLSGIREQLADASSGLQDFCDNADRASQNQKKVNAAATSGIGAIGNLAEEVMKCAAAYMSFQAITSTISNAINYASDLVEVQNVVDVTFEESANEVNEWAQTTLNAFGLSELAAKKYSGTMGAMLKSSGLAGDAMKEMSINLTQLAGDVASFYNLDFDLAFEKIRSGMSGETEPLKQLGINMSVANMEAYALANGITTSYSAMSQADQEILRYNYLMDALADSQGDFARTQDSYANQLRLLQGQWEAFTGTLATSVLPALVIIVSTLNSGIQFLQENASVIEPILMGILTIIGLYTATLVALTAVKGVYAAATSLMALAEGKWSVATFIATATQQGLNAALLACPITWILILIIAVVAAIVAVCQAIANASGVASSWFGVMTGGINVVIQAIKNIITAVAIVASNMITAFSNAISSVQSMFYNLLSTAMSVISSIASALNALPFVNIDTSGLTSAASSYKAKADAAAANKKDYKSLGSTFQKGWASNAFKSGASWGDSKYTNFTNKIKSFGGGGGATATYNTGSAGLDTIGAGSTLGDIANNTGSGAGSSAQTAANTAKAVDVSDEQLQYLRDIAEQEVINRFTTAEIAVNMTNNNNVSSSIDLDGMISSLTDGVREAMAYAAEGV